MKSGQDRNGMLTVKVKCRKSWGVFMKADPMKIERIKQVCELAHDCADYSLRFKILGDDGRLIEKFDQFYPGSPCDWIKPKRRR